MHRPRPLLAFTLLLALAPLARAQDSFKDLIAKGDYPALAERLAANLDLDKADPALRRYLELNLDYLRQGAPQPPPGEGILVVRGLANDIVYPMPKSSGGDALLLPPGIRFSHQPWTRRLRRIGRYFEDATTLQGGHGATQHELLKIIRQHASSSDGSVLVSASTVPQALWGPPYAIIRIPPQRAIFNHTSPFTGEREVPIPFFVLPSEIVAVVDSMDEVEQHPLFQTSPYKELEMSYERWCPSVNETLTNPVWQEIEANIRQSQPPLHHVVPGEPACPAAPAAGFTSALGGQGGFTSGPQPTGSGPGQPVSAHANGGVFSAASAPAGVQLDLPLGD